MLKKYSLLTVTCGLLTSCTTIAPLSSKMTVPIEQKQMCIEVCESLDMQLGAMVIISSRSGCVCENPSQKASISGVKTSAAALSTMATIVERQQRQSRSQ